MPKRVHNATKKKYAALALAVSLWMANGAFWMPGVASAEQETEVTITSTKTEGDPTSAEAQTQGTNPTLREIETGPGVDNFLYSLNNGTKMKIAGGDCTDASFYAGYSDFDSEGGEVSGYTLTVNSGTFSDNKELVGGYSLNGTANNNNVYINGGKGVVYVFGGRGSTGASGNTVDITHGTVGEVIGGRAHGGVAGGDSAEDGNKVTISGGNVKGVYGGVIHEGKATGNSVTVSGGTIEEDVHGGRVFSTFYGAGDAENNTVTVSGGTINGSVYGGVVCSSTAEETDGATAATGNTVTISETDTAVPTIIKTEIYGGFSAKGAADKNVVTISSGAIGTGDTNNVYGGCGNTDASENKVTISGGTMSGQVYGGYTSATGTANKNVLKISSGTVNSSVTGGYVDSLDAAATAEGNTVTIEGGTVNGDVNGGVAGSATDNTVEISGGNVKMVYGGVSHEGKATGNSVTVSGGTIEEDVHGGRVFSTINDAGDAENNTVTVSGGTINGSVYGGVVCSSTAEETDGATAATGNSVTISEGGFSSVTGGKTTNGNAVGNEVILSGGAVNDEVYGGSTTDGDANDNEVTVSGTGKVAGDIYGGYSSKGKATGNTVTISGGTIDRNQIYGGYSDFGAANDNTVEISGGKYGEMASYELNIYGGHGSTNATGNSVTISKGRFSAVTGGKTVDGNAVGNKVILSGGAVNNVVYGGITTNGDANDNEVTVSGTGNVASYIYGGYCSNGKATGNIVKISVESFYPNNIIVGSGATSTDNTLVLDAKGIDVNRVVGGVQTIAMTENVKFEDNTTVLKAGKFANDNKGATNFDGTLDLSAASFAGEGTMTLLEVTSGEDDDNLATMTVAYKDGKDQTQIGTLTVDTPVQIKAGKENDTYTQNNVTMTYDSDVQQVAMKDAGQKVVFESGINGSVKDVAMGTVQWQKGSTAMDAAGAGFTLDGNTTLTDNLDFDFVGAEKDVIVNDSMTLLAANQEMATLSDDFKNFSRTIEKEYSVDTAGVSIGAKVTAAATASGKSLLATITANQASKLTFTNVDWLNTGALIDHSRTLTNVSFEGAEVDTGKIGFKNLDTLATDSKMTLVAGFGSSVGAINGSVFTVGKGTGEGYAYLNNGNLLYLVTKGVSGDTPAPTPTDVSNQTKTVEPGQTVTENVVAATATGDETATSNTAEVEQGGVVGTADNPANLTGATTERGEAKENLAKVTGGTVTGDVIGGMTKSGTAEGNKAIVTEGGTVIGDMNGAVTQTGIIRKNEANITGSSIVGYVEGAYASDGLADGNMATVTSSTVTGGVRGADVEKGNVTGNRATINENSMVEGDIMGAYSAEGDAVANQALVSNSTVNKGDGFGDVLGAETETGVASGNTATVTNSNIVGDVLGGISDQGEANTNEAHASGGIVGGVYGGYSYGGSVKNNTARVDDGAIVNAEVYGGGTNLGDASGNKAIVTGSTVKADEGEERYGDVIGGLTEKGTASGNTAAVTDSNITGGVYGGYTLQGKADNNNVNISGTTVKGDVYGGCSEQGTAEGNKVEISGDNTELQGTVYGGKSSDKSDNNYVTMTGGTVGTIVGGGCDTAAGNVVTIADGEVLNGVYGAKAGTSATNNQVIMSGGTVKGVLYGGYAESGTGTTTGNIITLYGDADVSNASLYGGNGTDVTGNVLVIGLKDSDVLTNSKAWTGGDGGQTVKNISNFETINYNVVPWSESTAAVTISDGTASDLSMTTVSAEKVAFTGVDKLSVNNTMTLLDQTKANKKATSVTKDSSFTVGTAGVGTGTLSLDDNSNVIYRVESLGASEQAHNTVMGAEVSMTALSAGNDFIGSAVEGLGSSSNAGSDGLATYANMGGGSMKVDTGSHVRTHTWNAILALGHKNEQKLSTTEYGAFFEYGTGNYSTFDGDNRGDGSIRYTGGGILGKWQNNDGFYLEGSLRVGSLRDDASNVLRDGAGNSYSYNTDATYWGAHIGVGKELKVNKTDALDLYAKYFYNHRGSVSFDAAGHYDLDAVESSVLRIGTRYTVKKNDSFKLYGGIAVEHEFTGRASGTATPVGGTPLTIRGADISGTSVRGEIGATFKPDDKSNMTLDLNLTGYAGKKQGITGGLSAVFHI